ncbi:MAG: hypothetical protein MUE60_10400 [Candidatus Eisenbacteria bacterium]|jgi:hypothetical protein|nr:hypothetical protein [Candidatus Eisenbacteria bacterium]
MRVHMVMLLVLASLGSPAMGVGEFPPDTPSVEGGIGLTHASPPSCSPYRELGISVSAVCATPESLRVTLHFRQLGTAGFLDRPMTPAGRDLYQTSIPARIVGDVGVEYYIGGRIGLGTATAGSPEQPFTVPTAYRFGGEVPAELPGDDFLRETTEVGADTPHPGDASHSANGSLETQIVLILVLAALGFLVYQRVGAKS